RFFAVQMGVGECRSNSVSYLFVVASMDNFEALIYRPFAVPLVLNWLFRRSGLVCCAVGFFKLAHFEESHQDRQCGFRSLIFVCAVGMQAVAAPAGGRIVELNLKIVVSPEPVPRGAPCFAPD